ncbi:orotidine-5'-phosphate decarboxylase [bacterium]|jgi:orotidine 5'-phosphate decarboxylase subfamily 2|nr:orotidine-5'-phosphate decarboxylase [Verrucomicrobiales bacterium]MDB4589803.1 orotidine-5'-phosphate decarboxylase [Verrucomicrobiales bacterium]MDC3255033.1 orotidine-5'-phosphate decarboxylase [bacterium]MDF1785506.1 orotidine-5'-phosphate decarboxylase [Verrucomicrobiales bacterium]
MTYADLQLKRIAAVQSNLCVGLDPRPDLIAGGDIESFVRKVMEETASYAAAFKPNMAYFEALGSKGVAILERVLADRPREIPIILDAKRSDIGETQKYYAKACFEHLDVEAVTLNPFLGYDSLEPFLAYEGRGLFILTITSNAGSQDVQMQPCGEGRVFQKIQDMALRAPEGSTGMVVGLTNAEPEVLDKIADLPLLLPGLGAQGGDLQALAGQGRKAPILVNVSRGLLFAQDDRSFAQRAQDYRDQINAALNA